MRVKVIFPALNEVCLSRTGYDVDLRQFDGGTMWRICGGILELLSLKPPVILARFEQHQCRGTNCVAMHIIFSLSYARTNMRTWGRMAAYGPHMFENMDHTDGRMRIITITHEQKPRNTSGHAPHSRPQAHHGQGLVPAGAAQLLLRWPLAEGGGQTPI